MKFWKTACAMLFSLVLMVSQAVFIVDATAAPAKVKKCGSCTCGMPCCAVPATPNPQPVTPAPSRTISENQVQLVAITISLLLQQPEQRVEKQVFVSVPFTSLVSVPLYTRNCSFLI